MMKTSRNNSKMRSSARSRSPKRTSNQQSQSPPRSPKQATNSNGRMKRSVTTDPAALSPRRAVVGNSVRNFGTNVRRTRTADDSHYSGGVAATSIRPKRSQSNESMISKMGNTTKQFSKGASLDLQDFLFGAPLNYLQLTQGMLVLSALFLLRGMNLLASGISFLSLLFFAKKMPHGEDPTPAMYCALSAVAGLGCWYLVNLERTFDKFLGHVLGRAWSIGVAYFVYHELNQVPEVEEAPLELIITILEGRNLVPKDTTMLGYPSTSDPYVKIIHGKHLVGTTKTIKQTLDPKYTGETFHHQVEPSYLALFRTVGLLIYDYDYMGIDDPMGTACLVLPNDLQTTKKYNQWLPVGKGSGKDLCEDATGELLIEFQLIAQQSIPPHNVSSPTENAVLLNDDTGKMPVTIITKILRGRDLAPMDINMLGKATSSDPYVCVKFGEDFLGKTKIVSRTLNPKWKDEVFQTTVLKEKIDLHRFLELNIFDHDRFGSDDPMGTVYLKIPTDFQQQAATDTGWHPVERGQGPNFCKDAAGALCVNMQIIPHEIQQEQEEEQGAVDGTNGPEKDGNRGTPEYEVAMKSIEVTIVEGRNLVAKDVNMLGKPSTSDPYVKVYHGPTRLGKTKIVRKTLTPKWKGATFHTAAVSDTLHLDGFKVLVLKIYDYDMLGSDDPMGTVYVPIPSGSNNNASVKQWYPVETGDGKHFCEDATGELLVDISVICQKTYHPPPSTGTSSAAGNGSQRGSRTHAIEKPKDL